MLPDYTDSDQHLLISIQQYSGYDSFRPLQREAMLAAMESRDSLTVLPTGGGKSLCYQAPICGSSYGANDEGLSSSGRMHCLAGDRGAISEKSLGGKPPQSRVCYWLASSFPSR